jgi:hypothetical protein
MKFHEFAQSWEDVPNHFARWGFGSYLVGNLLKLLLILPVGIILLIWVFYQDFKEGYEKARLEEKQP